MLELYDVCLQHLLVVREGILWTKQYMNIGYLFQNFREYLRALRSEDTPCT